MHGVSNLRVVLDGWRILRAITAEVFRNCLRRSRSRKAGQTPETDLALPVPETDLALPAVAVAADMSKD